MNKKIGVIIAISIVIILIGAVSSFNSPDSNNIKSIFHVTLADPGLYENGIYTNRFEINPGLYEFGFVPNGDSPKELTITLNGKSFHISENFKLEGTQHETGISIYYTWDYLGNKQFQVQESLELEITIDPHGNELGAISVDITSEK